MGIDRTPSDVDQPSGRERFGASIQRVRADEVRPVEAVLRRGRLVLEEKHVRPLRAVAGGAERHAVEARHRTAGAKVDVAAGARGDGLDGRQDHAGERVVRRIDGDHLRRIHAPARARVGVAVDDRDQRVVVEDVCGLVLVGPGGPRQRGRASVPDPDAILRGGRRLVHQQQARGARNHEGAVVGDPVPAPGPRTTRADVDVRVRVDRQDRLRVGHADPSYVRRKDLLRDDRLRRRARREEYKRNARSGGEACNERVIPADGGERFAGKSERHTRSAELAEHDHARFTCRDALRDCGAR